MFLGTFSPWKGFFPPGKRKLNAVVVYRQTRVWDFGGVQNAARMFKQVAGFKGLGATPYSFTIYQSDPGGGALNYYHLSQKNLFL